MAFLSLDPSWLFPLALSLKIAAIATILVTIIGGTLGYLFAQRRSLGWRLGEALVTLPLLMPPTVVGFYLLVLFSPQGLLGQWLEKYAQWSPIFTWQGAVLAATIMALPLMVKTTKSALLSVDISYLETAATLGQSEFEILWRVWFPLARRGIGAGVLLSFTRALGEFGATLMMAGNIPQVTQTMPLAIYEAVQTGDDRRSLIFVAILSAISLVSLLVSNHLEQGKGVSGRF